MWRTVLFALLLAGSAAAEDAPQYAIGIRPVRFVFVPNSFFAPYLQASTQMNSVSTGLEFIYRHPTYDVVASIDFMYANVDDGNWLANGHDPSLDTHYVQFRGLSFLSTDVSIIGHHTWASAPWFELRYGAGVGLGLVLGQVLLTNNSSACNSGNVANLAQCHPLGVDLTAKNYEDQLAATEKSTSPDTAQTPHRHVSPDVWPVAPVINILIGFKFRLHKHVSTQVEIGFRDAMFLGVGLHYWF